LNKSEISTQKEELKGILTFRSIPSSISQMMHRLVIARPSVGSLLLQPPVLHKSTTWKHPRSIFRQKCQQRDLACFAARSLPCQLAVKPGTTISALDIYKDKDPPTVLPRNEYPEWLGTLALPLPSLVQLKKMPMEESTDYDQRRYLKLTRRQQIKANNEANKKK
jgi:hypothetical protein